MSPDDSDEVARTVKLRFGASLRAARIALGLTQKELGVASGHDRVYVQRIETGRINNPSLTTMVSLATAVSLGIDDLLKENTHQPAETLPIEHEIGSEVAIQLGALAIELPPTAALEAGQVLARHLGKPVTLIDPKTRIVSAIVGSAAGREVTRPIRK